MNTTTQGMSIAFMEFEPGAPIHEGIKPALQYVGQNMRISDKIEVHLSHKASPAQAVAVSAKASRQFAVIFDPSLPECQEENPLYRPLCIGGVCPQETEYGDQGLIWMLGTDLFDREMRYPMQRRLLARATLTVVQEFATEWPRMGNMAYAENKRSLRWLQWLGFDLGDPVLVGDTQAKFVPFSMEF